MKICREHKNSGNLFNVSLLSIDVTNMINAHRIEHGVKMSFHGREHKKRLTKEIHSMSLSLSMFVLNFARPKKFTVVNKIGSN